MTIIFPEHTSVQNAIKVKLMTAVANLAAPSLASEVNAASSLDVSCFIINTFSPQMESATVSAPPRLCSALVLPVEGLTTLNPITVDYIYDPQEAPTTDNNKAKAFLLKGVEFFTLVRKGLDARTDDFTAAERGEVWKFKAGRQNLVSSGDDAGAVFVVRQQWFPLIEPVDAVIAA